MWKSLFYLYEVKKISQYNSTNIKKLYLTTFHIGSAKSHNFGTQNLCDDAKSIWSVRDILSWQELIVLFETTPWPSCFCPVAISPVSLLLSMQSLILFSVLRVHQRSHWWVRWALSRNYDPEHASNAARWIVQHSHLAGVKNSNGLFQMFFSLQYNTN